MPDGLLLVAHGSRDPRAAAVAHEVAAAVEERVDDLIAEAAFLELAEPDPRAALANLDRRGVGGVTILPFLLNHAYHSKTDLPGVATAARMRGMPVRLGSVLGPHDLILDAIVRQLTATGVDYDAVVLAAAGSTDPEANATVAAVATTLSNRQDVPVTPAYASAAEPTVSEAVGRFYRGGARLVAVVTYLLAPGYFADAIRDWAEAEGAAAVTAPLGGSPEIVDVVIDRLYEATSASS